MSIIQNALNRKQAEYRELLEGHADLDEALAELTGPYVNKHLRELPADISIADLRRLRAMQRRMVYGDNDDPVCRLGKDSELLYGGVVSPSHSVVGKTLRAGEAKETYAQLPEYDRWWDERKNQPIQP